MTHSDPLPPVKDFKRFIVLVITVSLIVTMCGSCSYQWHLTKAMQKNPKLSLTDTTVTYQIQSNAAVRFGLEPLLMSDKPIVIDGIRVQRMTDATYSPVPEYIEVECPPDSIITRIVPRLVKVDLTNKELFQEAKERLTEWQIYRLAQGMIWSAFALAIVLTIVVRLYFQLKP